MAGNGLPDPESKKRLDDLTARNNRRMLAAAKQAEDLKAWERFAAAALSGLLGNPHQDWSNINPELLVCQVSQLVDQMMEEREGFISSVHEED